MGSAVDVPGGKALLSYMEECRPVHELFRQVLTQVAGYALLIMTRKGSIPRLEGSIRAARMAAGRAHENLAGLEVPAAAGHHYHHLLEAGEAIRRAFVATDRCTAAGIGEAEREDLARALKAATQHLRATARLLPGFETVDFRQACCAACTEAPAVRDNQNSRQLGGNDGGLFDLGSRIRGG